MFETSIITKKKKKYEILFPRKNVVLCIKIFWLFFNIFFLFFNEIVSIISEIITQFDVNVILYQVYSKIKLYQFYIYFYYI